MVSCGNPVSQRPPETRHLTREIANYQSAKMRVGVPRVYYTSEQKGSKASSTYGYKSGQKAEDQKRSQEAYSQNEDFTNCFKCCTF
jgi:hypothetical protein